MKPSKTAQAMLNLIVAEKLNASELSFVAAAYNQKVVNTALSYLAALPTSGAGSAARFLRKRMNDERFLFGEVNRLYAERVAKEQKPRRPILMGKGLLR